MLKSMPTLVLGALAIALVPAPPAQAQPPSRMVSGSFNGMEWTAQSLLTGVFSTGNPGNLAGDPLYHPVYPQNDGVVHLLMDFGQAGSFICSGALLSDRRSILTAAHCVSDGPNLAAPLSTTVFFQPPGGLLPGSRIQTAGAPESGVTAIMVSHYFVNGAYTGDVIDQNDIAVLRLSTDAPAHSTAYGLFTGNNLTGQDFTIAGYGNLGAGASGTSGLTARLRTGDNRFDFALGNPVFGTNWATVLAEPFGQIEHSWLSDFDSGLAVNDASCLVAQASNIAGPSGSVFCNLGRGNREVGAAGGDSGGPSFIGNLVAGVSSYGLSFGPGFGDSSSGLNSSFGEFSGQVPVYLHAEWIQSVMVPEPGTYAMMALGLAAVVLVARRRRD